jgi:hypothetical protein
MTDEEAEALFQKINNILRRQGLPWLAAEIAGEAAEGQASPKMLSVQEYADNILFDETAARQTRRKTEFTHVRALTPREKIGVSIKALRAIIVSSGKILPEVINTLNAPNGATISFVSETDIPPTVLSDSESRRFSLEVIRLDQELQALGKEASDGS